MAGKEWWPCTACSSSDVTGVPFRGCVFCLRHPSQSAMLMAANNTVEVWMAFDKTYRCALTIPLGTCMNFAVFPLPWLSYLGPGGG